MPGTGGSCGGRLTRSTGGRGTKTGRGTRAATEKTSALGCARCVSGRRTLGAVLLRRRVACRPWRRVLAPALGSAHGCSRGLCLHPPRRPPRPSRPPTAHPHAMDADLIKLVNRLQDTFANLGEHIEMLLIMPFKSDFLSFLTHTHTWPSQSYFHRVPTLTRNDLK